MKHDYLYDIIDFWLSNEEYEYYLEELIKKDKRVFNLKEKPLMEILLDKFITSCNCYIENKETVDKDYYVRLFNKMYNSSLYNHTGDYNIKKRINDYLKTVSKRKMSDTKKTSIIESINCLGKNVKQEVTFYKTDKKLIKLTKQLIDNEIAKPNRYDLTNEVCFTTKSDNFNNKGVSYSIKTCDDTIILSYHIADISSILYDGSNIYKNLRENNMLDRHLLDSLSFKNGVISPCLTISLEIEKYGKIKNFRVFKSIVKPSFEINEDTKIETLKANNLTKDIANTAISLNKYYRKDKKLKDLSDITKLYSHALNEVVGKNIFDNDYPFIYKVHVAGDSNKIVEQLSNLNYYLFRIPYDEFKIIYDIICNKNNNKAYYSCINLGHFAEGERYKTEILKPFTCVGINSLNLITDLYIKGLTKQELEEKYQEEFNELVKLYNKKFYSIEEKNKFQRRLK